MAQAAQDDPGKRFVRGELPADELFHSRGRFPDQVRVPDGPGEARRGGQVVDGVEAALPVLRGLQVRGRGGAGLVSGAGTATLEQEVSQAGARRRLRHQRREGVPRARDVAGHVADGRRVAPVVVLVLGGEPDPPTALPVDGLDVVGERPGDRPFGGREVLGQGVQRRQAEELPAEHRHEVAGRLPGRLVEHAGQPRQVPARRAVRRSAGVGRRHTPRMRPLPALDMTCCRFTYAPPARSHVTAAGSEVSRPRVMRVTSAGPLVCGTAVQAVVGAAGAEGVSVARSVGSGCASTRTVASFQRAS